MSALSGKVVGETTADLNRAPEQTDYTTTKQHFQNLLVKTSNYLPLLLLQLHGLILN